ncbi:nucleotidyltransferase family protein [Candidatus Leptofilum sp.]|uniref:nucleotidyltransferase family protein n=1 Tax=Candidatus Leptofilum sp. TaxID=3241576 RepID=UPI003B5B2315
MTTSTATFTTQQLLDALRPNQQPDKWFQQAKSLDWGDFAVRAIAFGLAPQIYAKLQIWDMPIPAKAMAKLAVTYKAQAKRSEAIYQQLAQLLAACEMVNLQPVALKGVHLAACYYAEPALRPMNDIDLLFTPDELPQVEALLLELGYGGKHKSAETGARVTKHTSTYRRAEASNGSATPNPYLSASLDRTVEPHGSLEESWFGLKVDITPGIRGRVDTAVLTPEAPACHVLNPTDLLHHICLHFSFHLIQGAPAFVQLTDLLVITQAGKVDWHIFLQRVAEAKSTGYVLAALTLAQKLVGAPVPANVLAQLAEKTPAKLRQRIAQMDLAYLLRRTQQKPLVSLGDRLRRGMKDRIEIARWAPTLGEKLRVWQTAVQFGRTDTAQMLKNREKKTF